MYSLSRSQGSGEGQGVVVKFAITATRKHSDDENDLEQAVRSHIVCGLGNESFDRNSIQFSGNIEITLNSTWEEACPRCLSTCLQ